MILAVITALSMLEAAGGLNLLVEFAERFAENAARTPKRSIWMAELSPR